MRKLHIKNILVHAAGAGAAGVGIWGCYPIGMAYFSAVFAQNIRQFFIFPIILISLAFFASATEIIKYGLSMICVMLMVSLFGHVSDKRRGIYSALVSGVSVSLMNIGAWGLQSGNRLELIKGALEGVFVCGASILIWAVVSRLMKEPAKAELKTVTIQNPGKERIRGFAKSFEQLAQTFYQLPRQKETLSNQDMEYMFHELSGRLCKSCDQCDACWKQNSLNTYKMTYDVLNDIEQNGEPISLKVRSFISEKCRHPNDFLKQTAEIFKQAKMNLLWSNKIIENRVAVADQLQEMAHIMVGVADDIYDVAEISKSVDDQIKKKLRTVGVAVKNISVLETKDRKREIYITMKAVRQRCVSTKDIGVIVSKICNKRMVPSKDSRLLLNGTFSTILFVDDTNFQTLYGVARATKARENVSGDNFAFVDLECGESAICLSDGMGSGLRACQESEMVIELLEQFLGAGFCKETAIKMINSTLIIQSGAQVFSTVDMSVIDLYSGVCEFLKIGASTTFIKRDNWVETITSTSLPMGVFHKIEFDSISKKLYDGDFVIMMTDGVLDALPTMNQEEIMQDIIRKADTNNPKEMAKLILDQALSYGENQAADDMTVLVAGVWKK